LAAVKKALMTTALLSFFSKLFNPVWLTGPLLDKELRVSSRRRRNYILRFAYVLFLTIFVAIAWLSVVKFQGTAVYQKSRMGLAGKSIITTIVTFQFIATQLIAIIMLSTSISDEIYHRTLGVLMTTPITSFQIVMGKLFSKLLQLILLLAISLPLLAIVRVFGGVPWNFVLSSLCITLTAVIFAGSLSLYFSINNRRAYVVIIKTVFTMGVLFGFFPTIVTALVAALLRNFASAFPFRGSIPAASMAIFGHLNPFGAMSVNSALMMSPTMPAGMPSFYWPLHCVFMLGGSALLVARSVKIVRKVALRQAVGQLELTSKRKRKKQKRKSSQAGDVQELAGLIRRVKGSPVLWKELRAPMIQGGEGKNSIIGLAVTIAALLLTYGTCANQNCLNLDFTHVAYTLMFTLIGMIFNIVLSATSITSEKESRSWPILLATSMDDWQILWGKAVGVFRRCLPIWFLLAGHILLFVSVRYIHSIAIVHLFMIIAGLVVFLSGVGLYFSALLRRTTSAVVANFAFFTLIWIIIPVLLGLITSISPDKSEVFEAYVSANPVVQVSIIMYGAGGDRNARMKLSDLDYNWPLNIRSKRTYSTSIRSERTYSTTGILLITTLIYISVGVLFAWRAKCRFRRNVF
jgi:ABC-type transport system involved in multi-copper enzyme maturation permease subunit